MSSEQSAQEKLDQIAELIVQYGQIDGSHHKMWVLDQIYRVIMGDKYDSAVAEANEGEDGPETYTWDTGIVP